MIDKRWLDFGHAELVFRLWQVWLDTILVSTKATSSMNLKPNTQPPITPPGFLFVSTRSDTQPP